MKRIANRALLVAVTMVMMGAVSSFALSDPILVNTSPCHNRHWTTVFTNEVSLKWNWDTNATSAKLEIVGMSSTVVTEFNEVTSNYLWQAFANNTPSNEDVYNLTLTFYNSGSAVIGALTSQLAVVKGAFNETAVISTPESTPWPKLKDNAVISYDAGWSNATASESRLVIAKEDGMTQTNELADASGYFGWKIKGSDWGYGTFNLTLTFPETEGAWNGTLIRVPDGMLFKLQ